MSFDGLYVGSQSFINTLLQRGVLRVTETQTRFNGFYGLSKTAEAVSAAPPPSCTPLKQGVNEKNPLRMPMFVKHSCYEMYPSPLSFCRISSSDSAPSNCLISFSSAW